VDLTLVTDNFGYETYWDITDCNTTILASGGFANIPPGGLQVAQSTSPGALSNNTTYNESICLPDGCYCFNIYDDFGDGICCTNGNGSYLLMDQFGNTLASGGSFTLSETGINFCVTSTPPIPGFTSTSTNICAGDSITFTDTSTSNPISWLWTFPGGTPGSSTLANPTITYNTSGLYNVTLSVTNTVTTNTQTFTNYVTVNPNPLLTISNTDANCACNGDATVVATAGSAPYTYLWNDPIAQTTATANGLCVGSYNVSVIDANGCVNDTNVTIMETGTFTATIGTSSNVSCNGSNDGSASVSGANGTIPYTYLWSNNASTSTITGLGGGTYNVTVTDAAGCTAVETIIISEPAVLTSTTTIISAGCSGSCNGSATVNPAGGTGPYSYLWNDPAIQTTASAVGLCAGTFIVSVTDANGCTSANNVIITDASPTTLNLSSVNATCGNPDGSASVGVSGGNNPYTYFWNDPANQNTATAINLLPGGYTVVVVDVNGCSTTGTISVNASGGYKLVSLGSAKSFLDVKCSFNCPTFNIFSTEGLLPPLALEISTIKYPIDTIPKIMQRRNFRDCLLKSFFNNMIPI